MGRLSSVKEKAPELLSDPSVVDAAEQADILHNLKALYDTPGGKELVKILLSDVVNNVHKLGSMHKEASRDALVSVIAEMTANLNTARVILNSKDNLEFLDSELEEMLRDE